MTDTIENLSGKYIEKLKESHNPGVVLAEFFCDAFNISGILTNFYILFNKLLKMYSRDQIFVAILDCYDFDHVDYENPYPLLVYLIKKRLVVKTEPTNILNDKTVVVKKLPKTELKRIKELDPFNTGEK